ncbi:hypothetical protein BDZ97DRAFT_1812380 [Flammula alnicola]|nr:hypothetical protein BDZ97DRAFT_1812380 [Flammula alnicola]
MPPKGGFKKKPPSDGTSTPLTPSLAVQLSYLHQPRPFKNPHYTKNINRRAKNLKTVLAQERERERVERETRKSVRDEPEVTAPQRMVDAPEEVPTYITIEAPPSVIPHTHLCDITGLEVSFFRVLAKRINTYQVRKAPYTDPTTGLRYHDKNVYEIIKGLSASIAKDYLSARGVNSIVK